MTEFKVNSQEYWDHRFETNWDERLGREQSRFFSHVALEFIPMWLSSEIRNRNFSICDWGCAEGDGTDVLTEVFDPENITGIDFSSQAIARASETYPQLTFLAEDWVGNSEPDDGYDVVFTSNTLEHFHEPHAVMRRLFNVARKCVIILIPYREFERHEEHHFTFTSSNLYFRPTPDFTLVHSQVVNTANRSPTYWSGMQILLVYARDSFLGELNVTLGELEIADERAVEKDERIARCTAQIDDLGKTVSQNEKRILDISNEFNSKQEGYEKEIMRLQTVLEAVNLKNEGIVQDLKDLDERYRIAAQQNDRLSQELGNIHNSRGWKFATFLHRMRLRLGGGGE